MTTPKPLPVRNRRLGLRKSPRSTVRVECRFGSSGLGKNLVTRVLDIAEGGVRLVITEALAPGDEVEVLVFGTSQNKPIKRLANICWTLRMDNGQYCAGLGFQKRLLFTEVVQNARP
jgi:hypothetical protein